MNRVKRGILVTGVLIAFTMMAIASSSAPSETKEIVPERSSDDTETVTNQEEDVEVTARSDNNGISIDEQVLIDHDGLIITALSYDTDSIWGEGVKVHIENNTSMNLTVSCEQVIVNDYMISNLFYSQVASGKKANDTIYLSSSSLGASGIDIIGQIEIFFHIYDSETYDTFYDSEVVVIKTSAFDTMDIFKADVGNELVNQDGIRIVGKYVDEDTFWGTSVLLFIENNTGESITISCENMSINNYMVSPLLYCVVYDGKMAVDDITIFSSDLNENNIESIENIELSFFIYNTDTYSTILDTGPISFDVQE